MMLRLAVSQVGSLAASRLSRCISDMIRSGAFIAAVDAAPARRGAETDPAKVIE